MKKLFTLIMACTLCMGMAVPAMAVEGTTPTKEESADAISLRAYPDPSIVNYSFQLKEYDAYGHGSVVETYNHNRVILADPDTEFTVSHVGTDPDSYIYIYCKSYDESKVQKGTYSGGMGAYYLTEEISPWESSIPTINNLYWDMDAIVDHITPGVRLYPGDSVTFTLPECEDSPDFYQLFVEIYYKDYGISNHMWFGLSMDKTIAETDAGGKTPVFNDVPNNAYYAKPVEWAVKKKITSGTSATTFSPEVTCSHAHILTFLWNAAGSPDPTVSNPFTNISTNDYYYKAALWAYENGMLSGNTFNGNLPCTRSETVTYMWQAAGKPSVTKETAFMDVASDAGYAQAVAWAVDAKVTAGTSATTFSPDATCTRGQIVTFLYNAFSEDAANTDDAEKSQQTVWDQEFYNSLNERQKELYNNGDDEYRIRMKQMVELERQMESDGYYGANS